MQNPPKAYIDLYNSGDDGDGDGNDGDDDGDDGDGDGG